MASYFNPICDNVAQNANFLWTKAWLEYAFLYWYFFDLTRLLYRIYRIKIAFIRYTRQYFKTFSVIQIILSFVIIYFSRDRGDKANMFFTTSILHFKAQIIHNRRNLAALTLCYIQSFVSLVVESVELSFCALSKNEQRTARRLFCTSHCLEH